MSVYQEKVLDHYQDPRNFCVPADYSYQGEAFNRHCGDEIKIYLKVNEGQIKRAWFSGQGCILAIASASILTEKLAGRSIDEVRDWTEKELDEWLGEVSRSRQSCVRLSLDALNDALSNNSICY